MSRLSLRSLTRAPGIAPILAALLAGCASFDAEEARRSQTESYTNELARLEAQWLAKPLALRDCVEIALTNNLSVRKAALDRELGRVNRDLAFSAFLPRVSASVGYGTVSDIPAPYPDNGTVYGVKGGLPVFMPSTWFLYAQARHGRVAAEIAERYTRQSIILTTTSDFYGVRVQEQLVSAYEAQAAAASNTADRVAGLAEEGLARPWERDRARALVEKRTAELHSAERQLAVLRAELLRTLGLGPFAPIRLSDDSPPPPSFDANVTNLVLEALATHPELSLADRQVVIAEHKVREAFCDFLPKLAVFAQQNFFDVDFAAIPEKSLLLGFSGTWDVFCGFTNVQNVRAAENRRRRAELERQETFLSVMSRVLSAEAAVRDAADAERVAAIAYEAAKSKAEDLAARSREGLESVDKALDAEAERDLAEVDFLRASYGERVALANLALALGRIDVESAGGSTVGQKEN